MLPGTRTTLKVARMLTEGEADFLSLVPHGANQTPFKVVKRDGVDIIESTEIVQKATVTAEDTALTRPNSDKKIQFQSVIFKKAQYDESRAKEFMTTMGFAAYNMEETDFEFIAKSPDYDKFATEGDQAVRQLPYDNGVTFNVGFPQEGSTVEKSVQPMKSVVVVKGLDKKEVVEKFDAWAAYYSSQNTLGGVLADGMYDGMPPGYDEISVAYMTAIGNAVVDGDVAAIKAITTEMGDLLTDVVNVFLKYVNDGKMESQKMTKALEETVKKTGEPAATEPAPEVKPEGTEAPATTETPVETPAPEVKPEEPAKPAEEPATTETQKTDVSLADILAAVSGVQKTVEAVQKENTELKQQVEKSNERLGKLEGTTTQPKGDTTTQEEVVKATEKPKEATVIKSFQADPNLANVLSI